ncbi:hypothetical protein V6N13_080922 [Hibiscus sabdariffa]
MSMLEIYDMVKELGYNSPQEIYWQSPAGVLSVNPLKTDSDVLSMLATMPRNKYANVYLQEIVDEQLPDLNAEIIRDAEISEHVETVRNVETELPIDAETVRNVETELPIDAETVRNTESEQSESEDEDTDYVDYESEQSDSPFDDSDNDLVDDDLVCDVQMGVGRDIPGFRACSSEDSDEGVDSEVETESLHSECDSETEVERNRFPEFNSVVDIENPKFKKGLLFSDQKIFKAAVKQYAVKTGHYQGWLLAAVGIDANDCIYPFAFDVVKSETRDSWTWFLQILETDLEITNSFHYIFMSDKQKGLIDSISELFPNSNSRTCMILESRDKPILTMMEMIRCKIMSRIAAKKEAAEKIIGTLCPKIQKKLDKILEQFIRCWPRNAGGQRPEDFVNPCYRKETQLKIYSHMVKPLRGPKQWSHYQIDEPILPPVIRRPVGRPQTKRRKEPDEPVKATGRLAKLGGTRAGRNARPSMSNTSEPMPTAHASQSSTMPTARATTSKLSVRRKTCSNSATSSHPSNSQHHQQGSESTLGPPMLVRWMLRQSTTQESQTQETVSKK